MITCTLLAATQLQAQAYRCPHITAAPVLDGNVATEGLWQTVPVATGFRKLGGSYVATKQTTVRFAWGDDALYVAITCEEPDAGELRPNIKDGGDTWLEDSIELFLQPEQNGQIYQFSVTAGGAKGCGEGRPDLTKWAAAARITASSYTIEMKIPHTVLCTQRPDVNATWRGTVGRNTFVTTSGGTKFTSWSALDSRYLEPHNFATLVFLPNALSDGQAAAASVDLNATYRRTIEADMKAAGLAGRQYLAELRRATKNALFAKRAAQALADWNAITVAAEQGRHASLPGMRTALSKLNGLVRESEEIKYSYLIEELLAQ